MINEPDYSDPAYWESQGITILEIDLNDDDSIDAGIQEIVGRVLDYTAEQPTYDEVTDLQG